MSSALFNWRADNLCLKGQRTHCPFFQLFPILLDTIESNRIVT